MPLFEIDERRYHDGHYDSYCEKLVLKYKTLVFEKYSYLNSFIEGLSKKHSNVDIPFHLSRLILGSIRELQRNECENEELAIAMIRKDIMQAFPVLLENLKYMRSKFFNFYEPRNIYGLYLVNQFQSYTIKMSHIKTEINELTFYSVLNNLVRAIKGSMIMFFCGDDIHGMSIMRGVFELIVKYQSVCDEENLTRYVKFCQMNALLQEYKNNPGQSMNSDLAKFLNENNLTPTQAEHFLLYSYVQKDGRTAHNFREFCEMNGCGDEYSKYSMMSEFVHEDYVFVKYDYPKMRESGLNSLCGFLVSYISAFEQSYTFDGNDLVSECSKKVK